MSSFIGKKHLSTLATIRDLMNAVRSLKMIIPSGNSSLEWCLLTIPGGESIAANNWQGIYKTGGGTLVGNNYDRWIEPRVNANGMMIKNINPGTVTFLALTLVRSDTTGNGSNIGLVGLRWEPESGVNNVEYIAGVYMQSSLQEAVGGVTWGVFTGDWGAVIQPSIYLSGSGNLMDDCYLFILKLGETS